MGGKRQDTASGITGSRFATPDRPGVDRPSRNDRSVRSDRSLLARPPEAHGLNTT